MEITKDRMKIILENAPAGADKKKIIEGLINKGHTIEGLDSARVASESRIEQATAGNQFEIPQKKGFLESARDFAVGVIGGGKVAEGAGMALAAPEIQKQQERASAAASEAQKVIIKRIREKKEAGEDTSRLERALALSIEQGKIDADVAEDFVDALPSDKEVIGSAIRLAGSIAAPTIGGGIARATGPAATGIVGGAVQGAKIGAATGAIEGAIQGGGLAAEADKSTEEILASGLLGGVGGGISGGVLGGAIGGISGSLKRGTAAKEGFVEQLVAPKQTASYKEEALRQGRVTDPGFFRKAEIAASNRDKLIAESVRDVVKPKATIGQNIDAIRYKVDQVDDGVREYIAANKVPFNGNQLKKQLLDGKEDLNLIFASDQNAEKTYNAVVDAFMNNVGKKDTAGLFEGRQTFDQIPAIKKLLETDKLGENARKEIVLAVRRQANKYISSLLPTGNPYKSAMLEQTYALEALGNIAEKSVGIVGKNQIQLITEKYPLMKWVIGSAIGGSIAGGIGAGAVAIGSTD